MIYRVSTRFKPLNVRAGPGLHFRVLSQLARGTVVTVYETVRNQGGTWHRVERGWVTWLYLEPMQPPSSSPHSTSMSPESLPSFLNFRPGLNNLRSRLTDLQSDLEHAEERFTTYSQMAAQHGSRIYEMDEDSRYWREIEELGTMAERFTDGADPGVTALERGHDLRICREMEENAAQWATEVERLEREIAHVHRQIEDFENSAP